MSDFTLRVPRDEPIIVITRSFAAPRALVFEAMTDPEHVGAWWGPKGSALAICEIDLRVGGQWRFVFADANGRPGTDAFKGIYLEIEAPKKLVNTMIYEPVGEPGAIETLTLDQRDGRTFIKAVTRHEDFARRDAHVAAGMEQGARETYDRLGAHLAAQSTEGKRV